MVAGVMWSTSDGAPEWDVVVGTRFLAAVPAGSGVAAALARRSAEDPGGVEDVVSAVPLGGADAVDSFAVVWWADARPGEITAVVRGSAVVDLASPGGARRFDARGIRPFHLAEFRDIDRLRVTDASAPLTTIAPPPTARTGTAADAGFRASTVGWASSATAAAAGALHDDELADADTILSPRRRAAGPVPERGPHNAAGPETAASDDPTALAVARARRGLPALTTDPVATSADIATQPLSQVRLPPYRFRIAGGAPRAVDRVVLLGRRPAVPAEQRAAGEPPDLVVVPSPRALVSGTHLELRMVGARLVATDLRSTNGTTLRTADVTRRLRSGESVVVPPGAVLGLGDDTIVEILPPEEDAP